MKILVTGSNGQLGSDIRDSAPVFPDYDIVYTDIGELDITDEAEVDSFIGNGGFEYLINCAAYTAVDRAESEPDKANLINSYAVRNLASACNKYNVKLIHLSTDFIFDGEHSTPYVETDDVNPVSVYGSSKYRGEIEAMSCGRTVIIIRTAWLYSAYGSNFVKTVLRLAREKRRFTMVFDQVGTPTYSRDLALAILKIIPFIKEGSREIYHFSNEGVASWYDFAVAICETSGVSFEIIPIETREYPTPARRPHYSVLNKAKIKKEFGIIIPYWRDSLRDCISRMKI